MVTHSHEIILQHVLETINELNGMDDIAMVRDELVGEGKTIQHSFIDSLDLLDIVHALDKHYAMEMREGQVYQRIPLEGWTNTANAKDFGLSYDKHGHPILSVGGIVAHIEEQLGLPVTRGAA